MKDATISQLLPATNHSYTNHHYTIDRATLYVGDLHPDTNETDLRLHFCMIGPLVFVRICRDRFTRRSLCYGYIHFFNPSHAEVALATLNHTELRGKPMRIMWCQRDSVVRKTGIANLFVKNLDSVVTDVKDLDSDFTENQLKEKFSEYGNVTSAVIMKDAEGGSRGFGFVNFESPDSAKKAIEALNGALIGSKEWFVGKAMKKAEREVFLKESRQKNNSNASNLFVKNIATSVNAKTLKSSFGKYGKVVSTKVIRHKNGVSKGIGFVCFSNAEEAKKACDSLNGKVYHGKLMIVSVAMSKEEYAQRSQTHFASENIFSNNQYFNPYYGNAPVYAPYWQPNIYTRMQVFPYFRQECHQEGVNLSYGQDQKLFKNFNALLYRRM